LKKYEKSEFDLISDDMYNYLRTGTRPKNFNLKMPETQNLLESV